MYDLPTQNALRLLQSADELRSRLTGEFSSIHGLSVNDFFLLMHLEHAQNQKLSRVDLAKRMHVSASTVTRMAAPMEKIGMVGREVSPHDARLAFVVLTDAGQERLTEAKATFAKRAGYLFQDRWQEAEMQQLSELLFRLVAGSQANLT